MEKNYEVWFHVNDNDVIKEHNDHMLVGAENTTEIMQEFKRRIDEEFDYNFSAVDLTSLDVYEGEYDMKKDPIDIAELKIPEFLAMLEKNIEKEIDFTNKVDEREEVIDDGEINAILYLTENDYKEIYDRGGFEEKTGLNYEEYKNSDLEMNVYAVSDKAEDDNTIKVYATLKDDVTYEDGYIPLTDSEYESLVADVDRAVEVRGEQEYLKENENADVEYDD